MQTVPIIEVLLVEDSPTDALIVQEELTHSTRVKFVVTHVERLTEAFAQLKSRRFDVALLDLSLPDSSGYETFARLREAAPDVPIVLLSGLNDEELAIKAVQAGAQDYFVKGHLAEQILPRAIRHAIERKRGESALRESELKFRNVLHALPAAIYTCDAAGRLTLFNQAAAKLWGREPELGKELWCGSAKLLELDGTPIPFEKYPMLLALKEGGPNASRELVIVRPDGSRRNGLPFPVPLFDSAGAVTGGVNMIIDITERNQAEMERERFFELSHDLLCVVGFNGYIKRVNPAFERILGFTVAEMLAQPLVEFLHPDDRTSATTEIAKLERDATTTNIENRYRCKDGSCRWFSWTAAPYPADDTLYAVGRDITERKRADETLRASEGRFRRYFELGLIGMAITSPTKRLTEINDKACDILGYDRDELLRKSWPELTHPDDRTAAAANFDRVLSGEVDGYTMEKRLVRKGGQFVDTLMALKCVRRPDGVVNYFVSLLQDITERKRADGALRASQERFRQVVEGIREVFWMIDVAANRFIYVSPAYDEIWGQPPTRLFQSRDHFVEDIHPEDRARYLAAARGKNTTETFDEIFRIVRPDGKLRWIRIRAFPVRNAAGEIYRITGVADDITERKTFEEQSLRAQRLESIGMLAAGITHDLNNVLAPIGMAATLLRSRLTLSSDIRLIDTLEKCADRGAGLVRQILGFVHGIGTEPSIVQVKHLLHDITAVITETFPKSIQLQEKVPNELWPILANPTQIHQVLLNLCVNARDAMPNGGTLTVRAENCTLDSATAAKLEGATPGAWLVLHIQDTGTGIPPEIVARMWEPFFSTKSPSKGTGLGLSTVRGIVETCHGFITLETAPGRGTTFRAYLPAVLEAVAGSGGPHPGIVHHGHGELILLVDDEEFIRELAGATLTKAGYRVIIAADGYEATAAFEANAAEISLVITDLDMPFIDGGGLAQVVHAFKPALKILAMSGAGSRETRIKPINFAAAFMAKPFTTEVLLAHVQQLLSGSAGRCLIPTV